MVYSQTSIENTSFAELGAVNEKNSSWMFFLIEEYFFEKKFFSLRVYVN